MLIAGVVGGLIGQTENQFKSTHSQLYASSGAALAGALTVHFEAPDEKIEKLQLELKALRAEVVPSGESKILHSGPGTFNSNIPTKYKKLINPGEWKVSEIDQWVEDGENRLIHQDKVMELTPPSLSPLGGR